MTKTVYLKKILASKDFNSSKTSMGLPKEIKTGEQIGISIIKYNHVFLYIK